MQILKTIFLKSWDAGKNIPILLYHAVDDDPIELSTSPEAFRNQMKYFKSECNPVSISELELLAQGSKRVERPLMITFDDGLHSIFENAFPVLSELKIPFSIFLATGCIGKTFTINGLRKRMLGNADLQIMLKSELVSLGSHTNSHTVFVGQKETIMEQEILESNKIISAIAGESPIAFAYPKGKGDPHSSEIIKKYYKLAFLGEGLCSIDDYNPHSIPRINIRQHDGIDRICASFNQWFWKARSLYSWLRSV
jgi:peptidoglycan/xylan/chitin deacetylase (PgdA/CDA1 family)